MSELSSPVADAELARDGAQGCFGSSFVACCHRAAGETVAERPLALAVSRFRYLRNAWLDNH